MKIKFDSNQDFQLVAIRSVVDVFAGQPLTRNSLEWQADVFGGELLTEMGIGNSLALSDEAIFKNIQKKQTENELAPVNKLQGLHFSVEMETGTGKTYVYLRTLFELNARYGWKKFIIVVPSVAIREGVLNAIELTKEHFQSLYGNAPLDYWVYDSAQVSKLRQFSASNQMQLMVMNIQAFDKLSYVISVHPAFVGLRRGKLRPFAARKSLRFGIFSASRRKGQAGRLCYPTANRLNPSNTGHIRGRRRGLR